MNLTPHSWTPLPTQIQPKLHSEFCLHNLPISPIVANWGKSEDDKIGAAIELVAATAPVVNRAKPPDTTGKFTKQFFFTF